MSLQVCVVALGKIGLPLAVQFASKGHRVVGADVDGRVVDLVNAGTEPFPGEAHLAERLAEVVGDGRLRATTDTTAAVAECDAVVLVVPLFVDAEGVPDFRAMDSATRAVAAGLRPGTLVSYETTLPVGTTRDRWAPMLAEGSGLRVGEDVSLVFLPRAGADRAGVRGPAEVPEAGGWCRRLVRRARGPVLRAGARLRRPARPRAAQRGLGPRVGGGCGAGEARRDHLPRREHRAGQPVRTLRRLDRRGRDEGDRRVQHPAVQPHPPAGDRGRGHCIPIYPQIYLWNDPAATVVRAARAANRDMPSYAVDLLAAAYGDLADARVVVLGASYPGGVKESAFSGVFPTVEALAERGARVTVSDPMYSAAELSGLGLSPYDGGEVDAAVVQADMRRTRR
jgi:UDP-N-acetyl-D-mannosaminuronate dehydrogenase